ncbi:MAG: hypothetical protein RR413_12675 [Christensenellaceae bacterium]
MARARMITQIKENKKQYLELLLHADEQFNHKKSKAYTNEK